MASLQPPRVINIADLRAVSRRILPRAVFDYLDGGPDDEVTLRENRCAFEEVTFRPRNAVRIDKCDLGTNILGHGLTLPVLLAPVGYSRLMHPAGEIGAARAASRAGAGYILSTVSGYSLEEVRRAMAGPAFYQLYLLGGREAAQAAIVRARAAGYQALVVTIDTPLAGNRERDFRNGASQLIGRNVFTKLRYLPEVLTHPRWLTRHLLDGGTVRLPNVVIPGTGPMPLATVNSAHASSAIDWSDFQWIRDAWNGSLIVKGVLTADDARRACHHGASAVVVSNHGGRQLDGVPASLRVLPEIVEAVGGECEILLDSGIRRGSDIVKAICMGASAVLIGRAYAYGLAAGGEAGVDRALEILKADIDRTLRLLGCASVSKLNKSYIDTPQRLRHK
jgi:L-lactate dehydrogenase (cytochrome)